MGIHLLRRSALILCAAGALTACHHIEATHNLCGGTTACAKDPCSPVAVISALEHGARSMGPDAVILPFEEFSNWYDKGEEASPIHDLERQESWYITEKAGYLSGLAVVYTGPCEPCRAGMGGVGRGTGVPPAPSSTPTFPPAQPRPAPAPSTLPPPAPT